MKGDFWIALSFRAVLNIFFKKLNIVVLFTFAELHIGQVSCRAIWTWCKIKLTVK